MRHPKASISFVFFFLLFLAVSDSIREAAGCTCCTTLPDGKMYDLDSLTKSPTETPWRVKLSSGQELFVNFCAQVNYSSCPGSTTVCLNENGAFLSAGALSPPPKWFNDPNGGVQLLYPGGAPCPENNDTQLTTVIDVLCGKGTGTFVGGSVNGCQYMLAMESVYGCPVTSSTTTTSSTTASSTSGTSASSTSGSSSSSSSSTATATTSSGTTTGSDGSGGVGGSVGLYAGAGGGVAVVMLIMLWCLCCRGRCQMECPCPNPCCCCANTYIRI